MDKYVAWMAYIEQQVLGMAAQEGALKNYARRIEEIHGLRPEYLGTGLVWQTRSLSLLYTLILFPKEYWKMEEGDSIYSEIERQWSLENVDIITEDEKYGKTVYGFILRLRNALAHANVTFRGDDIEFSDSWNDREVYRARVSRKEVGRFLEIVGSMMASRRDLAVH